MNLSALQKTYAKSDVYDARSEAAYQAQRGGLSFVARRFAQFAADLLESVGSTIAQFISGTVGSVLQAVVGREIAQDIGAFAGAFGNRLIGLAGMGLAAGVSAGFSQMDYIHQKRNIRDLYKDELAARLKKPPSQVTVQDMEELAKTTPVLEEELTRARRQRNFAVPLAVVATLASFALVTFALPAAVAGLGLPALSGVGGFLVKTLVSMAGYYAVRTPLQAIGKKTLGLYDETANDRIFDIKTAHEKGVTVTPEQVVGVFVRANDVLDRALVKTFGKPYDELSPTEQKQAVSILRHQVPAEKLAADINTGAIKATELAFAASDQKSGLARKDEEEAMAAP
ncbi:MAG: hypothetical protein K2Q01_09825, partial [Rickettsiales bacterium]|nr:hypothetical protein [Rickettsiales bacterium]